MVVVQLSEIANKIMMAGIVNSTITEISVKTIFREEVNRESSGNNGNSETITITRAQIKGIRTSTNTCNNTKRNKKKSSSRTNRESKENAITSVWRERKKRREEIRRGNANERETGKIRNVNGRRKENENETEIVIEIEIDLDQVRRSIVRRIRTGVYLS